jgi:hypothetical protein
LAAAMSCGSGLVSWTCIGLRNWSLRRGRRHRGRRLSCCGAPWPSGAGPRWQNFGARRSRRPRPLGRLEELRLAALEPSHSTTRARTVAQPCVELVQLLLGQRGLYHGRGGRLMIFLRHNMMIIWRSLSLHPPTSQDHEVRLPYR